MRRSVTTFLLIAAFISCVAAYGTPVSGAGQRDVLLKRNLKDIEQQKGQEEGAKLEEAQKRYETATLQIPLLEKAVDPDLYVLGPYDGIVVSIMGPEPKVYSLEVLPEGDVLVPGVGAVHADGLTLNEFRRALADKVNMFFRNVELFCYLETPAIFRVFVTGEVENPGAVEVSAVERVTDVIEKAGKVTDRGSWRLITLERGGETRRIDLLMFLRQGDFKDNPFLRSGDRVHVPPRGWLASIYGQVKKTGTYEIIEGETVGDLIALAGGFTTDALGDSVLVSRVGSGSAGSTKVISSAQFDMRLENMDEIGVFDRLKGRLQVHVEGAARRTGRFFLAPGEGLADLIVRAGGFTDMADLSAAYIEKQNGDVVRVDLGKYLSPAPSKDMALEDGEVLTIPKMATTVTVGGEVNNPGEFAFRSDFTVAQYVGLAGGPTRDGSIDRVVIYAPDGAGRAAHRDLHPSRGDVIIVKRSPYSILGEFFSGIIRLGTVVVSIIVLTK